MNPEKQHDPQAQLAGLSNMVNQVAMQKGNELEALARVQQNTISDLHKRLAKSELNCKTIEKHADSAKKLAKTSIERVEQLEAENERLAQARSEQLQDAHMTDEDAENHKDLFEKLCDDLEVEPITVAGDRGGVTEVLGFPIYNMDGEVIHRLPLDEWKDARVACALRMEELEEHEQINYYTGSNKPDRALLHAMGEALEHLVGGRAGHAERLLRATKNAFKKKANRGQ